MTLARRVIPCLDVAAGRVVKGVSFVNLVDAGDPATLAAIYDAEGADELVFLDITATVEARATLFEVLRRLEAAGCRRFVHTEVARDGMLTGPATDRLGQVLAATSRPVIASGGVASLDDLRTLAALEPDGLEGAIVGKALYAGRFSVADAIAVLAEAAPGNGGRR